MPTNNFWIYLKSKKVRIERRFIFTLQKMQVLLYKKAETPPYFALASFYSPNCCRTQSNDI